MKTFHRPGAARWHKQDTWKKSAYAFVPFQTHFGELCGFADDVVEGGGGFGMHPHQNMEITTVMLRGSQLHEDSTGRRHVVTPTTVQTMSAGTGIHHSEVNASAHEPFHSFQIWVYPKHPDVAPRYEAFTYAPEAKEDRFLLALSPDGRDHSARINQDAFFSLTRLTAGTTLTYRLHLPDNGVYVHCASGSVTAGDVPLKPGDAVGVHGTGSCLLTARATAEVVLVEVPMTRGIRV